MCLKPGYVLVSYIIQYIPSLFRHFGWGFDLKKKLSLSKKRKFNQVTSSSSKVSPLPSCSSWHGFWACQCVAKGMIHFVGRYTNSMGQWTCGSVCKAGVISARGQGKETPGHSNRMRGRDIRRERCLQSSCSPGAYCRLG